MLGRRFERQVLHGTLAILGVDGAADAEEEVVASGMLVTLRPLEEDEPEDETYLLAESAEERASGVRTITTTSPLGKALLGANLEDQIAYEAPGGTFHYRVVAFEPRT